jgi:hypothetical protein
MGTLLFFLTRRRKEYVQYTPRCQKRSKRDYNSDHICPIPAECQSPSCMSVQPIPTVRLWHITVNDLT